MIVTIRNKIIVKDEAPKKYTVKGKAAKVGKDCKTSNKGKAIAALLPLNNITAKVQPKKAAMI